MPFKWEVPQVEPFKELQCRLQSPLVLGHFDEDAKTEIHMDTSSVGLGGIFIQENDCLKNAIMYAG